MFGKKKYSALDLSILDMFGKEKLGLTQTQKAEKIRTFLESHEGKIMYAQLEEALGFKMGSTGPKAARVHDLDLLPMSLQRRVVSANGLPTTAHFLKYIRRHMDSGKSMEEAVELAKKAKEEILAMPWMKLANVTAQPAAVQLGSLDC